MGKRHLNPPVSGQKKRQSYWKKIGDFKANYFYAAKRPAYTTYFLFHKLPSLGLKCMLSTKNPRDECCHVLSHRVEIPLSHNSGIPKSCHMGVRK